MRRILVLMLLCATAACGQTAAFVKTDTTTQGKWPGVYGHDGEAIWNGVTSLPSYAAFSAVNSSQYVWATGAADARDLVNGNSTVAACWYSGTSFYFQVQITDGKTHQIALYLLDWDNYQGGRVETVSITSPAGAVLASQQYSKFTGGVYAVFNVSGSVNVNITNNNPSANAVVSGVFFDSGPATDKVTLSWTASPTAGVTYSLYRNGTLLVSGLTATTYTDSTMVSGQTYAYTVASVSGGAPSAQVPVTAFVAP